MHHFDLILKGGHIIDPSQELNSPADIGLYNGRILKIQKGLNLSNAKKVIDVSKCILTPGLIDLHTHVYWGGTSLGIDAEEFCRKSAVTTAIDTGSTGPGNFAGFKRHIIEKSKVNILAFLHISHAGIYAFSPRVMVGESENLSLMDPKTSIEVIEKNRDTIVGVKVRIGRNTSGTNGISPLNFAKKVAEATNLPIMVHIDEAPPPYSEVVNQMRPLDILTHCFRPLPNAPIDLNGRILPAVLKARDRGVLFDIGHGMGSFSFKVAKAMLEKRFFPDTISSDIHAMCINGPAHDLVTTMSKFLNLGMPFYDIIKACTLNASSAINRPEIGNLKVGKQLFTSQGPKAIDELRSFGFDIFLIAKPDIVYFNSDKEFVIKSYADNFLKK